MKENLLKNKSFSFAIRIVNLYKYLIIEKKEFVLSKQLLRSETSVGAMIREAEFGQTKSDFIHKLSIPQKRSQRNSILNRVTFSNGIFNN